MKKFLYSLFLILITIIVIFIIYLSTYGIETSKFNKVIIKEITKKEPNIEISLSKIRIKFDIKKIQIYFSTIKPQIVYQNIKIPIKEINLYSKIISILKSKNQINQVILSIEDFKIKDVQKIAARIKPSNFKTYLLNNISNGKIEKVLIDLSLDDDLGIKNYKVNGSVKKINVKAYNNLLIQDVSLNFITDKKLTLINSLNAKYQDILISNGSLTMKRDNQIDIEGTFNSNFNLDEVSINKLAKKTNIKFLEKNKVAIQGSLLHNFALKIDENFSITDYDYKSNGEITESKIILKNSFKSNIIKKPIKNLSFFKTKFVINLNKKKNNFLILEGLYNLGGTKNKKFKVSRDLNKKTPKYQVDFNLAENFFLEFINFKSDNSDESKIKSEIIFINNNIIFNNIDFTENKNLISIKDLKINSKKELESISTIDVKTFKNDKENNNFKIIFKEKISVTGSKYDATYLLKQISDNNKDNILKNYTKDIEMKFGTLITKSQIPLKNFNLIGRVNKGKFEKISAKSEFSKNDFLDISLKKSENNKKILEIYSDLPQVLLSDYKFFNGLKDGKLLYSLSFDDVGSESKMTIENFKVVKAPAFAKLLTLADLGGIADLLSGDGMSFDILEINMKSDNNVRTIEEILALGPSLSVLMEGYIENKSGLVSLSGTLVPAKTLNNIISKIPVVGGILVGDKVGDGVFGVSFKMKGLPGKVKTTVNPVKTLTPRFITRALEKMKKTN